MVGQEQFGSQLSPGRWRFRFFFESHFKRGQNVWKGKPCLIDNSIRKFCLKKENSKFGWIFPLLCCILAGAAKNTSAVTFLNTKNPPLLMSPHHYRRPRCSFLNTNNSSCPAYMSGCHPELRRPHDNHLCKHHHHQLNIVFPLAQSEGAFLYLILEVYILLIT